MSVSGHRLPGISRRLALAVAAAVALACGLLPEPAHAAPSSPLPTYRYQAPQNVTVAASVGGSDTIVLSWASRGPAVRYQVRWVNRWTGRTLSRIVDVPVATITGLWAHTRYYLRVRVVDSRGKAASPWSSRVHASTQTAPDPQAKRLTVATYNVHHSTGRSWKGRRKAVAAAIAKQHPHVVGLQEAEAKRVASGVSQYRDLMNLLGKNWRVTSTSNTAGTRIIYDSKAVTLVRQGSRRLSGSSKPKRYVVWAVFTQKSSGRSFFFANTHLVHDPGGAVKSKGTCSAKVSKTYKARKKQAGQVIGAVRAHSAGLPVVLTGDMNSHKFNCPTNAPYRVYTGYGLVDPIGNPDRSRSVVHATTELRVHTQYDTSNHFKAAPKSHGWVNGSNVDYIWVSKAVTTLVYETVVNLTPSGRFVRPVPSDHNMVRATVLIPAS